MNKKEDFHKVKECIDPIKHGKVIYATYRGSYAHGCYVENLSDDIDIIGCYVAPSDYYVGINTYKDNHVIMDGCYDIILYEVKKYLRLLAHGNPNVISSLWVAYKHILLSTEFGELLNKNRDAFISNRLFATFNGYAKSQFERMTKTTGNVGAKRKKLIEKTGYNCKHAHHCIRLLRMFHEFLCYKDFFVDRTNNDRKELLAIKNGEWTLEEVMTEYEELDAKIGELKQIVNLGDSPDWFRINALAKVAIWTAIVDEFETNTKLY